MMFNRARLSAFAIVALIGGFLTPVVVAPPAQAATFNVPANCSTSSSGTPISHAPGDIINFTGLTDCDQLVVAKPLVDSSAAITVDVGTVQDDTTVWKVVLNSGTFSTVTVTLGSTPGTVAGGIALENQFNSTSVQFDVTISGSSPTPPTPTPPTPPSAPTDATSTAGNASVTVSWSPPAAPGSFPVTNYQVQSTPSSSGCLVPVTATSCTIAGLANGTRYTFQVRALNGGGWGSWADAGSATPTPSPDPGTTIVITGSRANNDREVRIAGVTTGLAGATVQARVKLDGAADFADGTSRIVDSQGTFTWQRRSSRGLEVYFMAGDVESNTVKVAARD